MKDFKNVTFIEYQQKKKEMLDNLGGEYGMCNLEACRICPFSTETNGTDKDCQDFELFYPEKAAKIVMGYEPKVDWSKVPVDTKIYVRDSEDGEWEKAYFAEYYKNKVHAFVFGRTSWADERTDHWNYAKLAKEGE